MQESLLSSGLAAQAGRSLGPLALGGNLEDAMAKGRKAAALSALAGTLFSMLLMTIGARMIFHLSPEDFAFGDACGGSPPSASLFRGLVDRSAVSDLVDNSSASTNPSSDTSYYDKTDGAACSSTTDCIGVCAGGRCMLSDYGRTGSGGGGAELVIAQWTLADFVAMVVMFLTVAIILTAQRAHFPGVWQVTCCFIITSGAVFMYSFRAEEGMMGGGTSSASFAIYEPVVGVLFIFAAPFSVLAGLWAAMCLLAEVTIGNLEGSPLQGAGAEMFRFVFPVMAACVLAIALMFQTCCPKTLIAARRDRNRATAAQQQLTNLVADDGVSLLRVTSDVSAAVASLREPRKLSRVICIAGLLGVLATLNLTTSAGMVWSFLGSAISFQDCSSFTDQQLSGVQKLVGFVCTEYPKAMACGSGPGSHGEMEPESEPHGPYNPDHIGYNTGLATTDDPLIADFRHAMWLYKFGLFVFMGSSLAAIFSTERELEAARPKRFELSAGAGWWSSAHVVLGVFSLLGALLVGIGAHGMFALDADDVLYGNGKGGPAPLGPLQRYTSFLLDLDDFASRTDLNQSTQTAADANQPDYRSKSEGSACTDDRFCKSGVCVPKLGSAGSEGVCVLDDFAEFARSPFMRSSPWENDYYHALASSAFFRPMWASLCVAATGFVPMQWGDRQLNRPAIQSTVGAGAVMLGARAWIAWSSFPEGWLAGSTETNSLRSIYMTLIDCSDFSQEETVGMRAFASGYFCYKAPKIQTPAPSPSSSSATFQVQSGGTGCHTAQSGRCVRSPNYPDNYNNNDRCTITISGEASLTATRFETESCCDHVTIADRIGTSSEYSGSSSLIFMQVHVTSDTTVTWRSDGSNTASGWELCLSHCDSKCQAQPVVSGDSGNGLPTEVSGNMASAITGIASSPSEDYIVNPVLVSFVHSCAAWEVGLFFSVLSGFMSTLLAFPITCAGFCGAADLVLCFGRCCSVDVKPAHAGPLSATSDSSDGDALVSGGAPVAPVTTIKAPASMTVEPEPAPELAPEAGTRAAADYTTEPSVVDVLATCNLSQYHESLTALGVESVGDLKDLDQEDFEREAGMKKVEAIRLLRHLNSQDGGSE